MSSTQFGLTSTGFVPMRQSDCLADLQGAFIAAFGQNVNLAPNSVLGQIAAIFAERHALLWEAIQDVVNAQTVSGAEGIFVDNLLALAGLQRLAATATVTNPSPVTQSNGDVLNGLVLAGTPGTVIPAGSIIQTTASVPLNFTLDQSVTIAPAVNALQTIVLSQTPTQGNFSLGLTVPSGAVVNTELIDSDFFAGDIQAAIYAVVDPTTSKQPFTDVAVTQAATNVYTVTFGANTPATGQPASGARAQAQIVVATDNLSAQGNESLSTSHVNIGITVAAAGAPAQAVASATCTTTGPNYVASGALSVIGSPITGWQSVSNQLDCITGTNLETDSAAMLRRAARLSASASGPLPAIVDKVSAVSGVTAVSGFENTTAAAEQQIVFSQTPTTGAYALSLAGNTTASIAYSATASDVQAAIAAIAGYEQVTVTGDSTNDLFIDFGGALGAQAQPLSKVYANSTDASISIYFARPPISVEIVAEGGDNTAIAEAIFATNSGGIATYGAPAARTPATASAASTTLSVPSTAKILVGQTASGTGLRANTLVSAVNGDALTVTLSQPTEQALAGTIVAFGTQVQLSDAAGNLYEIAFSRPKEVLVYVQINLTTDLYMTPGVPSSGLNPAAQFNPASIATIQQDVVTAGASLGIGQPVIVRGTSGLASSFRDVAGVLDVSMAVGTDPNSLSGNNIAIAAGAKAVIEQFAVEIAFS
jgi:hypothetical protein